MSWRKAEPTDGDYLYRGISARPFERRFSLADHVEVENAACDNGLLQIDLARKIPEAMKPRRVEINRGGSRKGDKGEKSAQIRAV